MCKQEDFFGKSEAILIFCGFLRLEISPCKKKQWDSTTSNSKKIELYRNLRALSPNLMDFPHSRLLEEKFEDSWKSESDDFVRLVIPCLFCSCTLQRSRF